MARVRNLVLLLATICCYASISYADEQEFEGSPDIDHEQLVELASRIANEVRILELELSRQDNDADIVKSLSKRQAGGLPMNVPVKMSGFAFGKRDGGQLVRRSAGAGSKPVKLAGFAFGKRGQLVKRSSDDQLDEEQTTEKRANLDAFTFGKRKAGDLSAFSFGKRRDPLSALTFGKRGMKPSAFDAFSFGKRRDPLSAFSFGKRGMDPNALGAFSFGKRGRDNALGAFSFGKRGMDAFTFGKRDDEEGAFEDEDEKRAYNPISAYTFGKRDTEAAGDDTLNHNEETLRTD